MMLIRNRKGFTLVELLLVILLLSSMALVATAFVDNAGQQMGFDQTKSRLELIRRAIIGDTSRTINREPELSGFVADMGRLPESLSELIEPPANSSELWGPADINLTSIGVVGALYGGWRGPYLETLPETSGTRSLRDGWANQGQVTDASAADYDGKQFGWVFTLKKADDTTAANIDEAAHIFMQSLGADFASGQTDAENPYHQDYPPAGLNLVTESDWRVNLRNQPVRVQVNRNTTDAHQLQLRIYSLKNRVLQTAVTADLDTTISGRASQEIDGVLSDTADVFLPMGTHAAIVVCRNETPVRPYDGNCPSSSLAPVTQYFKIIPRSHQLPLQIEWNTQ